MNATDIDWTQNCMTSWVHNGRDDLAFRTSLSEIDLSDAAIYNMVEEAIKHDAQQFVDHSGYTQEFADLICELWDQYFEAALKSARENAVHYQDELRSLEIRYDEGRVKRYVDKRNSETNSSWNDHVTYICRVCGTRAATQAQRVIEAEGKSIKQ